MVRRDKRSADHRRHAAEEIAASRLSQMSRKAALGQSRWVCQCGRRAKNVALCGLRPDGFHALLVQGPIACSVGGGSERWFPTPEASTRAPAFTFHVPKPSSE
jgi:hypothetical protein